LAGKEELDLVQVHDLGVYARNMVRVAVLCSRAVPCESPGAVTHRENIATEYEAVARELRGRALAYLDTMIADPKLKGVDGAVQVARLKTVRAVVNRDPFHRLDADYMEVVYYKLSKTSKDAFWLARYDENVVAYGHPRYTRGRAFQDILKAGVCVRLQHDVDGYDRRARIRR
jgi:hypothetical protein